MTEGIHVATEPCPECAQGKHGNCTGDAWCDACDDVAACPCSVKDHKLP